MKGIADHLRDDHNKVKKLFQEFEQTDTTANKQRIVREALNELMVHATLEEMMVYPMLREQVDDAEKVEEALEEHHVAKMLMAELWEMKSSEDHFAAKFKVLSEMVKHHIKEEESELLPLLNNDEQDTEEFLEQKDVLMRGVKEGMPAGLRTGAKHQEKRVSSAESKSPRMRANSGSKSGSAAARRSSPRTGSSARSAEK